MKTLLCTTALLAAVVATPYAASNKDMTTTKMPAVATSDSVNPYAPVSGSNSFTQGQVTERLGKAGYKNIRDLAKGEDGIWRAKADKGGMTQPILFDYQGNITVGTSPSMAK